MKTTVSYIDFHDAFRTMDRMNHFPDSGLHVLFDFLEDYEEQTGEELELDVIALCCDYSQMTFEDIAREYQIEIDDPDNLQQEVLDYLEYNTMVVGTVGEDQVIFAAF